MSRYAGSLTEHSPNPFVSLSVLSEDTLNLNLFGDESQMHMED